MLHTDLHMIWVETDGVRKAVAAVNAGPIQHELASLFAAAPDLLAACEDTGGALAYATEWLRSMANLPPEIIPCLEASFAKAQAAIAKARPAKEGRPA